MDKDFGQLIFVDKAVHAGLIRLPDLPADKRLEVLRKVLTHHGEALTSQAVITVRGGRIRVSRTTNRP